IGEHEALVAEPAGPAFEMDTEMHRVRAAGCPGLVPRVGHGDGIGLRLVRRPTRWRVADTVVGGPGLSAIRELERTDAGPPASVASAGVVLRRIPEGAVVSGVHG